MSELKKTPKKGVDGCSSHIHLRRTHLDDLLNYVLELLHLSEKPRHSELREKMPERIPIQLESEGITMPDSPGFPRRRRGAPIHELASAIDHVKSLRELKSLAHFLVDQYHIVGTEVSIILF